MRKFRIVQRIIILQGQALYVPLDTNQPLKRKEKIVNSAGINLMLTEQENLVLSNNCKVLNVTEIKTLKDSFEIPAIEKDYDRPAYIIFTSGTTGEPKGVIITHRAAMNTICNINQKYNITERDVFFGLANLSFDLSVYDIFGCYQVGGTLVLPDSSSIKDPKQLTELLVVHGVTVWNSVPAQMQMVINYMENSKVNSDIELRVVLLSGDWIPVNLPKKIYEKFNKSRVVSLGGATEASIWSIYYDIQREDDFEKSIPYGYPLANQKFYVLNENLQSCPDYVVGSLYIAGVGLSAGYLNDEKLNQEKYKYLPETGEKIYKTGDIGCYTRDGIILFKGREAGDEQVKIHGHRVELAEIRSVLNEHPLVESSVVLAMGESAEDLHINAVVAPVKKKELTSIHITNAEKENLEKLEKYYEEEIDQDLFERWINKSEEVVTSDIFNTFRCYSIFDKNDTVYSFDEIVQKMQIPEKLHKLTKRWLRVLIKEKVIEAVVQFSARGYSDEFRRIVAEIKKIFADNVKNNEAFNFLKVEANGVKNGSVTGRKVEILNDSSSQISALIASHASIELLNKKIVPGIYYATDIIEGDIVLGDLPKLNIDLNISEYVMQEESFDDEFEEGTI